MHHSFAQAFPDRPPGAKQLQIQLLALDVAWGVSGCTDRAKRATWALGQALMLKLLVQRVRTISAMRHLPRVC
jgi:hypothetical protein